MQPAPPADKLVIQLDPSDAALLDFWRSINPAAVAVAEGKPRDGATAFVCQVGGGILKGCLWPCKCGITEGTHQTHRPL